MHEMKIPRQIKFPPLLITYRVAKQNCSNSQHKKDDYILNTYHHLDN